MTRLILDDTSTMARKPSPAEEDDDEIRGRIDLRIEPDLERRLRRQAKRFTGGNLSAYFRLGMVERLEKDEASDPRLKE